MSELTHLDSTLTLPGCTLHKCGLVIDGAFGKEQLEGIGLALNTIGGSALWWWGDYLCAVETRMGEEQVKHSEDRSYAPGTLRNAKWVCSKLPLSHRCDNLTYTHHFEALSECGGDPLKAQNWLLKASKEGWSVAGLRAEIRQANATHKGTARKGQRSVLDFVTGMQAWVRTELEDAPPEMRAQLKRDLMEIVEKL